MGKKRNKRRDRAKKAFDPGGFIFKTGKEEAARKAEELRRKQREIVRKMGRSIPDAKDLRPRHTPGEQYQYDRSSGRYDVDTTSADWLPDEVYVDAQQRALEDAYGAAGQLGGVADRFGRVAEAGGMDAQARSEIEMQRMLAASEARGQREAALQQMAARGMAGSGAEMAATLGAGQQAANVGYLGRLQSLAAGQSRAQDAMRSQADVLQRQAGAMGDVGEQALAGRQQTFGEDVERGKAQDVFNMYNTEYQRGMMQRDTERKRQDARAAAAANQQAYENRERLAALMTQQWSPKHQEAKEQQIQASQDQVTRDVISAVGAYYSGGASAAAGGKKSGS